MSKFSSEEIRRRKHVRVRKTVLGTPDRPRLNVYRSSKHIEAQVIDDIGGLTLASASSRGKDFRAQMKNGASKKAARAIGKTIAELAKAKGVVAVVFDRGGYLYHGRIKELADGAREGGLKF
ncbi:MAG: 50S ribosomal protein L18 [Planctomycetota bacterium]|nr:50S ribosomal protein L18 [Planctomycetota bacterium]